MFCYISKKDNTHVLRRVSPLEAKTLEEPSEGSLASFRRLCAPLQMPKKIVLYGDQSAL